MFAAVVMLTVAVEAPDLEAPVREIMEESCTYCHDDSDDLDLTGDLSSFIGAPSSTEKKMIVPGKPDDSYFYIKLVGGPHMQDDLMPQGDDPLPADQIATIRTWIESLPAGAGEAAGTTGDSGPTVASGSGGSDQPAAGSGSTEADMAEARWKGLAARPSFFGTHQVNVPTTTTLGKQAIEMRIHHRFGWIGPAGQRSYLGLASGAVMSLGVAYGIVDGLDVLLRWSNSRLDWELGAKYVPLRQEEGKPLSIGVYGSLEWLSEHPDHVDNPFTGNLQLMVTRLWFNYWSTQLLVGYSFLTNHSTKVMLDADGDGVEERVRDKRGTLHLALASTVWLGKKRRWGIDLEYLLPIPAKGSVAPFYYNGGDADPSGSTAGSWSLGVSARAGLHLFQVMVANTRNIHTNLVAVGGDTGNPFKPAGGFLLGFNISRKWKL